MFHLSENTPPGGPLSAPSDAGLRALNDRFRHHSARAIMEFALTTSDRIAMVSSFGAESVVLLHMLSLIDRATPVLFLDTELLFTETLVYQQEVSERLGLGNVRILRAADSAHRDPQKDLHKTDPDACCALRKTAPLQAALEAFDGWITGRKRFQSGTRAALPVFEREPSSNRVKINPLAFWRPEDVAEYLDENRLPRHPLVARGYPSIGCVPCTVPVRPGAPARSGRWQGLQKEECGIHFVNGCLVRQGAPT